MKTDHIAATPADPRPAHAGQSFSETLKQAEPQDRAGDRRAEGNPRRRETEGHRSEPDTRRASDPRRGLRPAGEPKPPAVKAGTVAAAGARLARGGAKELVAAGDRTARTLQDVRSGHEANADQLWQRRAEFDVRAAVTAEAKVFDRISLELGRTQGRGAPEEPGLQARVGGVSATLSHAQPAQTAPAQGSRAEAAMEVVEKIEVWLKSNRPALTIGVGGALQAEVTVERTGPGRISLALKGRNGPPSHSDVRAVRDALEQRGLLLTSVQIA